MAKEEEELQVVYHIICVGVEWDAINSINFNLSWYSVS